MATFEANYLKPESVRLRRSETGVVELSLDGGTAFPSVRIYSAYPLAHQTSLVSVRNALDENETEIGLIPDAAKLEAVSRQIVEEELARRYFTPIIKRIVSLREEGINQYWEAETTRGVRQFTVKDPYEHVRQISEGRLLVTDTHECRYEIEDTAKLDKASLELLSRHIYF